MSDVRWVETPMFILRRSCITHEIAPWQAGHFLEVGAGTGRLTLSFLERKFSGTCYDLGVENRRVLRETLAPYRSQVEVVDSLSDLPLASFDYLFAFEVLEHIEDDLGVLKSWARYLTPGGRLLVSVPAHSRKFGDEDRAVGHYRRYEREQLVQLLVKAGFTDVHVLIYGFPLATLTRLCNRLLLKLGKGGNQDSATPEDLSIRSGINRSAAAQMFAYLLNRWTLSPFCVLQRAFLTSDLGEGYVAQAVKVTSPDAR